MSFWEWIMRIVFKARGKAKPLYTFAPTTLDLDEGQSGAVSVLKNGTAVAVSNLAVTDARFTAVGTPSGFSLTFVGPADAVNDITVDVSGDVG